MNILSDPEFSFSRVISLIRERLSREAAVADYPGDLSANQANRSNIAAVAAAAARAAADQLVIEDKNDKVSDSGNTNMIKDELSVRTEITEEDANQCPTVAEPSDSTTQPTTEEQQVEENTMAPILKSEQENSDSGNPTEDESTKPDVKLSDDGG